MVGLVVTAGVGDWVGVSVDPAGFVLAVSALKNLGLESMDAWRLLQVPWSVASST